MKKEFRVLFGVSVILVSCASAYSQTSKMTMSGDQGLSFSQQTLEKFKNLSKIKKIENLLHPHVRSLKVEITPIQNKCSFESLNQKDLVSELEPLDYMIYFDSNEIRKNVFLSLIHSEHIHQKAKAFVVSKFITGFVNQGEHYFIRESLQWDFPSSIRMNAIQKYLQCLLLSNDQENLWNLYQLSTNIFEGADFFKLLRKKETLSPVLHEMIKKFFQGSEEEFSHSRIYPPFLTFVQAFDPAQNDKLQGTVASHWNGADLLEKAVSQFLETGNFSSTIQILESRQRFDHQMEQILKASLAAKILSSPSMNPSSLGKRSAGAMTNSATEIQALGDQSIERNEKRQHISHDQISEISTGVQDKLLDSGVCYGSYKSKESEWLNSLGIVGQSGLYTNADLPAGKTILTYLGKIYDSEEALFEVFPENTWDDKRETDYLIDVSNEDGELLYIVSALETKNGERPPVASLINHTVPELANVEFKSIPDENAHKGYRAVVVTKGPIRAGSELKVFYGEEMHQKLLENNPEFKKFVKENFPYHLPKKSLTRKSSSEKRRISSHSSSTKSVSRLRHPKQDNQSSSKQSGGETSVIPPEFLALLDLSDQLFKEASAYSEDSQFEKALNKLSEAIAQLKNGFELISKNDHPISRNQERTLKYNLNYRLADLYWELAVNSFLLSQHLPNLPSKLKYSNSQAFYYQQSKHFYYKQREDSLDSKKNQKDAAKQEKAARKRIQDLSENSAQLIQEDSEVSYETAYDLKRKADELIGSEREKAISLYELALQYIQSEHNGVLDHGYQQYLEADLNWSLGEVYQENPINDIHKSKQSYERAIFLYQNLLENYSGILESDLSLILEDVRKHLGLSRSSLESLMEVEILLKRSF